MREISRRRTPPKIARAANFGKAVEASGDLEQVSRSINANVFNVTQDTLSVLLPDRENMRVDFSIGATSLVDTVEPLHEGMPVTIIYTGVISEQNDTEDCVLLQVTDQKQSS